MSARSPLASPTVDSQSPAAWRTLYWRVLAVFLLSLGLGGATVYWIDQAEVAQHKREAIELASLHGHLLQQQIVRSLSVTYGLAAVLRQGNGEIADFRALATEMLSLSGGTSAIQLAPNGVIRDSVPVKGHEAAIGHNLLDDPERNREAFLALKTRELTLAGPFELRQGGQAVVGRLPVFLRSGQADEQFWGFVTVLIRIPDLLRAAALIDKEVKGHAFALSRRQADGAGRQTIWSSESAPLAEPVSFPITVPNGEWTLDVERADGWHTPPATLLWQLLAVVLISLLSAVLAHHLLRLPLRLAEQVARRTAALDEANESLQAEIVQHWQTELALRDSERRLEQRVRERTQELERLNAELSDGQAQQKALIDKLADTRSQLLQSGMLAAVGRLAAGVAHEINNPMGFIMSNVGTMKLHIDTLAEGLQRQCQLLAPYLDERQDLREQLALIEDEMDLPFVREDLPALIDETLAGLARVKRVVQDLREFSAVDQADCQTVDLNACLRQAAGLLGHLLDGRIRLVWQLGDLPPVECNAPQIAQVLRGLLLNAAQAIDGSGEIVVTTRESDGWVDIEIADSGHGIAPENLGRVCEPFFTTRAVGEGMGLGLTVAHQVLKRHGGCLFVASPAGQGARVTVNLPVRRQAVPDLL
ncbi:MAG: hypothetical protein CVU18_00870 [Betaproteobacteria bacterium HGW-Betaproteobacteria-12]|nr:MAG: hypothetical protein CVU18_00870 [Betaproteobacteria bacterium HGW-Betaproteobacteria-12]